MKEEWIDILLTAVYKASEKMMTIYQQDFNFELKEDHSPVTAADIASSLALIKEIQKTGIMIISEEEEKPAVATRQDESKIWLIDPLDGTKEFIKKNDEFCIAIGLIEDGYPIFGLLADPVEEIIIFGGKSIQPRFIHYGEKDPLSEKHLIEPLPTSKENLTVVYSRSHFSAYVQALINNLESQYGKLGIVRKGSALKFFDLVLGRAQFYPRLAPTMEWDTAAGDAIYRAMGGEVLDFTNFEPLRYNKKTLFNPHFIAKPQHLKLFNTNNE